MGLIDEARPWGPWAVAAPWVMAGGGAAGRVTSCGHRAGRHAPPGTRPAAPACSNCAPTHARFLPPPPFYEKNELPRFPTATNKDLAEKLLSGAVPMASPRFSRGKRSATAFTIQHYAGAHPPP